MGIFRPRAQYCTGLLHRPPVPSPRPHLRHHHYGQGQRHTHRLPEFPTVHVCLCVCERQRKSQIWHWTGSDCFIFQGAQHHIISTRVLCCRVGRINLLLWPFPYLLNRDVIIMKLSELFLTVFKVWFAQPWADPMSFHEVQETKWRL